jgi:quinol monooxygenase YgiN
VTLIAILDLHLDADRLDSARQVLKDTLKDTRAFPGCLAVEVLTDITDPAHVVVHESWSTPEADAAYRAWRAGEGASQLGTVLSAPMALTRFTPEPGI